MQLNVTVFVERFLEPEEAKHVLINGLDVYHLEHLDITNQGNGVASKSYENNLGIKLGPTCKQSLSDNVLSLDEAEPSYTMCIFVVLLSCLMWHVVNRPSCQCIAVSHLDYTMIFQHYSGLRLEPPQSISA